LLLRKRPAAVAEGQDIIALAGADESTLVREERTWLQGRLVVGLEKTKKVLSVFDNDALADETEFDKLSEMRSLEEFLAALNGNGDKSKRRKKKEESVVGRVLRSVFNHEEWAELEASDEAIASTDEGGLRMLRLQRQRKLLWDTRNIAIELTVRDPAMAAEQTALVNESMQVMNVLLGVVGMNARGTMRRNVVQLLL
jgi:hypothetical protein